MMCMMHNLIRCLYFDIVNPSLTGWLSSYKGWQCLSSVFLEIWLHYRQVLMYTCLAVACSVQHKIYMLVMLQLDRPAHQLFAVWGQLVVLYQDGSLGLTDRLLYETNHVASLPFIVWSQLLTADGSACIAVVFRDKVRFVFPLHLSSLKCASCMWLYSRIMYPFDIVKKCGPMPNVMAALPNIGGALCSMPHSLADAHY